MAANWKTLLCNCLWQQKEMKSHVFVLQIPPKTYIVDSGVVQCLANSKINIKGKSKGM